MQYVKILTFSFLLAILKCYALAGPQPQKGNQGPAEATGYDYTTSRAFPDVLSAYHVPFVPRARLANSQLLEELITEGKLRLSLEDAIALALENNLDISVARYNLPIAQTDLLRAKSGGATRGVAGAYQSSTIFSGVIGGGVGGGGGGGGRGAGGLLGGGISTVGETGCCDPSLSVFYGWSNADTPLDYTIASGVPVEYSHTAYISSSYSQAFLTGTSLSVGFSGYRLASNETTQIFDPEVTSGFTVGINQPLLNGFGYRANAKFIRIAKNNQNYAMSVFRQNVINTVSTVMASYYNLLADRENIRVAQEAVGYAQTLLSDYQTELKIGAASQLELARAVEDLAGQKQDLLVAGNTFAQDAQSLKAEISKTFSAEIAAVQLDPTDQLPDPHPGDVPPLAEALREAAANRPEIRQAELNLRNQHVTIQAVRNELLPSLNLYASYGASGLAGTLGPTVPDVFTNKFPDYNYGVELSVPIRNRTAQADAARALLEQRQLQMKLQQAENQVVWDVSKAVSAVDQAKSQLAGAANLTALARHTLVMEQTKFKVGQAPAAEVIGAQRDLATAEDNEVKARATYAKALIQFEQATGTILERNDIQLENAVKGDVPRKPNIPGTPETMQYRR
jgi:outer membrane protein TolC